MGKEFEALEAKLDFACGQIHALKNFLAAFMAVSLERNAYAAAIPTIEETTEAMSLNTAVSDQFLDGVREVCASMKAFSDMESAHQTRRSPPAA